MIKKIYHYFFRFAFHPVKAPEELRDDASALGIGFWWTFVFCMAYSAVALIYYLLGHLPVAAPFLNIIPLEKWYLVQTFTTFPAGLAALLAYSGTAYLLSRALGGNGRFDAIFASQAFTLQMPCFIFMWVPEAFLAPVLFAQGIHTVPWPQWLENFRIFYLPLPWIYIISVVAISRIEGLRVWKSALVVSISIIPFAMIMAVFIR